MEVNGVNKVTEVTFEAIIVSIYTGILHICIKDIFLLGFLKHFLAGILGLHQWYCNYKNYFNYKGFYKFDIKELILQSIIEGMLFILLFNLNINIYLIPFILHITFEILGFHKQFCVK